MKMHGALVAVIEVALFNVVVGKYNVEEQKVKRQYRIPTPSSVTLH